MLKKLLAVLAVVALAAPAAAHAQESSWIHVRVDEADGAKVRVNLPATMVDVALEIADEKGLEEDHLHFGPDSEVSLDQMRRLWTGSTSTWTRARLRRCGSRCLPVSPTPC